MVTRSDQKVEYFFTLLGLTAEQKEKVRVVRVREARSGLNFYQDLLEDATAVAKLASVLKVASQSPRLAI